MKTLGCRMKTLAALLALVLFPLIATAQDVAPVDVADAVSTVDQFTSADKMEAVTLMGVINKDGDQLILNADNESYLLDTQVDKAMIGQKVVATGVVVDDNGVKMFKLQSINVAQ